MRYKNTSLITATTSMQLALMHWNHNHNLCKLKRADMRVLRPTQRWYFKLRSSGLWHHLVWW